MGALGCALRAPTLTARSALPPPPLLLAHPPTVAATRPCAPTAQAATSATGTRAVAVTAATAAAAAAATAVAAAQAKLPSAKRPPTATTTSARRRLTLCLRPSVPPAPIPPTDAQYVHPLESSLTFSSLPLPSGTRQRGGAVPTTQASRQHCHRHPRAGRPARRGHPVNGACSHHSCASEGRGEEQSLPAPDGIVTRTNTSVCRMGSASADAGKERPPPPPPSPPPTPPPDSRDDEAEGGGACARAFLLTRRVRSPGW